MAGVQVSTAASISPILCLLMACRKRKAVNDIQTESETERDVIIPKATPCADPNDRSNYRNWKQHFLPATCNMSLGELSFEQLLAENGAIHQNLRELINAFYIRC